MSEADRSALFGGAVPAGIQTRDVMRDDFGFEVPLESVPLPSNGVVYPSESALHMKETVEIRSMTAREEDILTSRALIKKGTVITELIKSCLIDKRIDVSTMLSGDRNALMVALRVTGYGAEFDKKVQPLLTSPINRGGTVQKIKFVKIEEKKINDFPAELVTALQKCIQSFIGGFIRTLLPLCGGFCQLLQTQANCIAEINRGLHLCAGMRGNWC
jgi:hypothetical protein